MVGIVLSTIFLVLWQNLAAGTLLIFKFFLQRHLLLGNLQQCQESKIICADFEYQYQCHCLVSHTVPVKGPLCEDDCCNILCCFLDFFERRVAVVVHWSL